MHFASDNWAGAHPKIAESLSLHAAGFAAAYGASEIDKRVEQRFNELFEREVAVFFVGTGTAANSLALASVNRPGGVSLVHREAHVIEDECGAPEYFTGGARLHPIDGAHGRIDPELLKRELKRFNPAFVHAGQPMAVSITQATEVGTLYQPEHIATISEICRDASLPLHMDGARFANALVSLDMTPAEMTWKQGVDIVSFGVRKTAAGAPGIGLHGPGPRQRPAVHPQARSTALFKTRFVAAQFDAYLRDDLWLELARHSNALAARLAGHINASSQMRLAWKPEANEVFAIMKQSVYDRLRNAGAIFYDWNPPHSEVNRISDGEIFARFVTSFANTEEDVDRFADLIA
ncbi:low specificity L-threonine aldolase [Ochrobactrum tritici]|uniref:Low specificity L-threonine aldolase n=1 Tax=Brucella tritici TaxID=94626 RepID=A0A7X6FT21_9HYPH|nr:low specificity L-threonine aldolase [Brucella tritici]